MQEKQRRALRALAVAIAALMLCVIGASAWLRLAQPRMDCAQWPVCRGVTALQAARAAQSTAPADAQLGAPGTLRVVRAVHRVAATTALLLAIAIVAIVLRRRPRPREWLRPALALLGLGLALSVLGVVTPGSRSGAVLLGNLLGGFLMLALSTSMAVAWQAPAEATPPSSGALARRASWVFGLWIVQVALGALSGAGLLHLAPPMHLALAVLLLPLAVTVGWPARKEAQPAAQALGLALLLIVPLQFVLGAAGAANEARAVWVLLHNASAAAGLALLLGLLTLRRGTALAPA